MTKKVSLRTAHVDTSVFSAESAKKTGTPSGSSGLSVESNRALRCRSTGKTRRDGDEA